MKNTQQYGNSTRVPSLKNIEYQWEKKGFINEQLHRHLKAYKNEIFFFFNFYINLTFRIDAEMAKVEYLDETKIKSKFSHEGQIKKKLSK
jgi:hypothetical protein